MSYYKPKRIRWTRVLASFIRGIAGILNIWPLFLIAGFFISPVGPHLRMTYTYLQNGSQKYMLSCQYLGSRGFVSFDAFGECPFVTIIDRRNRSGR